MKIIFDRNKCIGAFSCVQEDPDSWKPAEDGKVNLESSSETKPGIFECVVDKNNADKARIAAAVCPAAAIRVEE